MLSHPSRAVAAASLVIVMAGGRQASAHEGTLKLRPAGDPLQFVEWRPTAEGVLTAQRDQTKRNLLVTATPGAKVSLPLGCPPKRHGNWEVETDSEPLRSDAGEFAYVRATSAPGSSGDGTFVITTTASQREGDAVEFDAACVRLGPGADGVGGTADDTVEQRETLRAKIVTTRHKALLAATHEHDHDEGAAEDGERDGVPVHIRLLAAALARSTVHPDSWRYGAGAAFELDPLLADEWWKSLPIGVRWMYLRVAEAMGQNGELHPAVSNLGLITVAWRPRLAAPNGPTGPMRVSGRAQLGFGGGVASGRRLSDGRPVKGNSEAVGSGALGFELQGHMFGGFMEGGIIYSDAEAFNGGYVGAGISTQF